MKKIYVIAAALLLNTVAQAQVVDFENYLTTTESYDNGSAGNGDFTFGQLSFYNYYNTSWSSWTGFAISNITDNTTAGWGNQYSAFPGSGNNSDAYAVFYSYGEITAPANVYIDSFKITNATYAAISMRDGDAYGKQFGSIYDANNEVDSTNGEDYFRVWVIGEDEAGNKDSLVFYLADYRFADSTLDYIVDSWENIDLTSLTIHPVKVSFTLESSDNGDWGMNTPAYFAIDDVSYEQTAGVNELNTLNIAVYPNPVKEVLNIQGENGNLTLMDVNGAVIMQTVHNQFTQLNVAELPSGVYFLQLAGENGKAIQKIVK